MFYENFLLRPLKMSDSIETCIHDNIENGCCLSCGLSVNNYLEVDESDYSRQHQRPKQSNNSALERDINAMNLDQDILEWVSNRIYNTSKSMYKQATRNNIIFGLIYMAHLHLGKSFDPESLSIKMCMKKSDVEIALSLVSGMNPRVTPCNQEGMAIPLAVISPSTIIGAMCEELNIPVQHTLLIEDISRVCIKSNRLLLEENPRKVSIGIIKYYCDLHNIKFSATGLQNKITSSDIRKYKDMITEVYKN